MNISSDHASAIAPPADNQSDISILTQQIQSLERFVVRLEAEIAMLKAQTNYPEQYDQDLVKILYEISDASRRVGGYISLLKARTVESDRWILNRLTELGSKITHSEALINE